MSIGLQGCRVGNSVTLNAENTITASTTETCILAILNLDSNTTFFGRPNHLCYELEDLFVGVTSPNNVITTIRIYRNATSLTGTYTPNNALNNSTRTATNETGFSTGLLVKSIPISQDSTVHYEMGSGEEAIRNLSYNLQPGENYIITAQTSSSTTTVSAALSWHHI